MSALPREIVPRYGYLATARFALAGRGSLRCGNCCNVAIRGPQAALDLRKADGCSGCPHETTHSVGPTQLAHVGLPRARAGIRAHPNCCALIRPEASEVLLECSGNRPGLIFEAAEFTQLRRSR